MEYNNKYDVFVSHSSKDRSIANTIVSTLEHKAIKCWIAPRNIEPGDEWDEAIVKGLKNSKLVVLVFSSEAMNSKYVKSEISLAMNKNKIIIPFRIEDIIPENVFELYLNRKHWLDALPPNTEQKINDLVKIVEEYLPNNNKNSKNNDKKIIESNNILKPINKKDLKSKKILLFSIIFLIILTIFLIKSNINTQKAEHFSTPTPINKTNINYSEKEEECKIFGFNCK